MKSKSKTFEIQSEIADVVQFVFDNVETEDKEYPPYHMNAPEVRVETKHKYKITITTIRDIGKEFVEGYNAAHGGEVVQ